ncbi:MAG: hypothetical protein ACR2QE_04560 [Acidimicrobiales bacterium]
MPGMLSIRRRLGAALLVIGLTVAGVGCGSDGDDLEEFETAPPVVAGADR